ncbi:MAG: hypothetical protein DWQ19_12575 [Crenarchaeota archaeon]|nr:MAG: hypothetical protein DWQ19_12575 [Thermoproteota archaeon]
MPRIDSITPVQYNSLWPYHHQYDNLPLQHILARQTLINLAVDQNTEVLEEAKGSAGTLSNRLAQTTEESGELKSIAVDASLHNIGAHTDGSYGGTDYVRMTQSERDKLALVSDEASAIQIQFETISDIVLFTDDLVVIADSPTVSWNVESPSVVTANFAFPVSAAHEHTYDAIPVHANISSPDYINYKTTSTSTAFVTGSLRVYINGIRISESDTTLVYSGSPSGTWTATSFTGDAVNGTFALNRAIDSGDTIIIDFDRSLT